MIRWDKLGVLFGVLSIFLCMSMIAQAQSVGNAFFDVSGNDNKLNFDDSLDTSQVWHLTTRVSEKSGEEGGSALGMRWQKLAVQGFVQGGVIGAANGQQTLRCKGGMPKNSRQITEGYWLGSLPNECNVQALYAKGIRLVVTLSRSKESTTKLGKQLELIGIRHLVLPSGRKFPKPSKFKAQIKKYKPERVFIHCDHGGDRSGAMIAYLLVQFHGWSIPRALLAMLNPSATDVNGLKRVLLARGYEVSQGDIDRYLGIYSASLNGGGGGLKARSDDYRKLLNTLIDVIEKN